MARFSMTPATGEKCLRFVGDRLRFTLRADTALPEGWTARLRTDLGRARVLRSQVIRSHFHRLPLAGAQWHDVPMWPDGAGGWFVELPLAEVGYFRAKAYAIDADGRQHWPVGADVGVTVHPDGYRTANTIYCAFVRQFGGNRTLASTENPNFEAQLNQIDRLGYAVIPPSGKLRDLARHLPHIVDTLGCRILHLLPINPTPTVKARMGRFGSPYASQDLLAIDPALVEHENATTGLDQFRELAYAIHARGARLFIDLAINHTGWGSTLQENHPEWFVRDAKGEFVSPGAWGVTWGDLVELEQTHVELWDYLAGVFLEWCRRGVDGFRCDAGYKVPMRAWQYIIARVREEFPDALFLLEGLGGAWALTEELLGDGGMQWAYSELFQEFSGPQVQGYLDHAHKQSARVGVLVHYSETHDNPRLAACRPDGRAWSLLRNRLCALTSVCGGFGFTNGVEWLAREKIRVHQANGLNWGAADNIVAELASLNRLLADHPCFFDGARLTRVSEPGAPVYALLRQSADGAEKLLVLVNLNEAGEQEWKTTPAKFAELGSPAFDLVSRRELVPRQTAGGLVFTLPPAATVCLAAGDWPTGTRGEDYRRRRAQAAWALQQLSVLLPAEAIGPFDWRELAAWAGANPEDFLAACSALGGSSPTGQGCGPAPGDAPPALLPALQARAAAGTYRPVVNWTTADATRVLLVPPRHWLLVRDPGPFRVSLRQSDGTLRHAESVAMDDGHAASFAPSEVAGDGELSMERYAAGPARARGPIRFLAATPDVSRLRADSADAVAALEKSVVLLTNGLGGMARLAVDLGAIHSKYDCALAANLHPTLPVDRHVFVKRVRLWCSADGFVSPLNAQNLVAFHPGPPARWSFVANAGDGRSVPIELTADMIAAHNTTVFHLRRPAAPPPTGRELPAGCDVRLIVRVDIEDRNFHGETHRNEGAEHHFRSHSHRHSHGVGFAFTPAPDRQLHVVADSGRYHHEEEWSHCAHPVEATRGQTAAGDAFSPGWFELPLQRGAAATLTLTAHPHSPSAATVSSAAATREAAHQLACQRAGLTDDFGRQLALAAQAYVVRRDDGRTVIAGYPWFLDWGRDSLICARGLIAAGLGEEVLQLLRVFGRFEADGTLPNTIHGENASNRDTSDAPLWFGIVAEELASLASSTAKDRSSRAGSTAESRRASAVAGQLESAALNLPGPLAFELCSSSPLYAVEVDSRKRTIADVLRSIAVGYRRGTPNGIRVDAASGLVWSPSHFTWMDTNYPAGTPREGYPIEIQALWIRLLRQLERLGAKPEGEPWGDLAARAEASLHELYWLESKGWFADVLLAPPGIGAREAKPDDALRSNMLFAVSLGLVGGERARASVQAALRWLVVPGALRSLAPLEVTVPLEIRANHGGGLLNDPKHPYWGRYEGDEDTRRKPAYHNGTAWTWTFPSFCEALAMAHEFSPEAVAAARAYLSSADRLMITGCVGQIPEILDGDAPHTQRGCDAQAWGVTEALRVWKLLHR